PGWPVKGILEVGREDLDRETALREQNQLEVVLEELERDATGLRKIGPADPELRVDHWRVHEQKELFAPRRTALLHQGERPAGQAFGQLARVRDRRRRADEHRV